MTAQYLKLCKSVSGCLEIHNQDLLNRNLFKIQHHYSKFLFLYPILLNTKKKCFTVVDKVKNFKPIERA